MRTTYVASLVEGDLVREDFALRSKELRSSRTGEAYLSIELADKTGRISGVMFRPDRIAQSLPVGSVVRAEGTVTTYRGSTRVSLTRLRAATAWEPSDIMPTSSRDQGELLDRLRQHVRSIQEPSLARLVRAVFADKAFMREFKACPGAQSHHHAYLGGLLEHSVAVATLCDGMAAQYVDIDRDLLVTGALLHDIGKVDELCYVTDIDYTDEGRFIGHVVLGDMRMRRVAAAAVPDMPRNLVMRLSHLMLSHHGELEWGAPKRPSTLEALVLHHADNMDAKAAGFVEAASVAARVEEAWTDAANLFRRPLYAPRAAEDDRWHRSEEDDQFLRRGA